MVSVYDLIDQAGQHVADLGRILALAAGTRNEDVVPVALGTSLPSVLASVQGRDSTRPLVFELEPGGTFDVGADYTPPAKDPASPVFIRSREGQDPARINGEWRHPDVARGNWHFDNLWLQGLPGRAARSLVQHGSTTVKTVDAQPEQITYSRVLFDGGPGYRRGVLANSREGAILHSRFVNFFSTDSDAQALLAYNGGRDWLVADTALEASTEVVMLGGGSAMSPEMVPARWTFLRCHFHKPRVWQSFLKPTAKNLVELKAGINVKLLDCVLEGSWAGAQNGAGIVIKACNSGEKNADGTPGDWVRTEDITVSGCLVSSVGVGLVLVGKNEGGPTQQAKDILIEDTLFHDIGKDDGLGVALRVADGPENVTLTDVAFDNAGNFCDVWPAGDRGVCRGWKLTRVVGRPGPYGFKGEATGAGKATLDTFFPGIVLDSCRFVASATVPPVPGVTAIDEATLQIALRERFESVRIWK